MDSLADWLFAPAVWAPAAVVVVGVAAVIYGLSSGQAKARTLGLVVALLGGLWFALDAAVQSWPERARQHAESVVAAYDSSDWPAMGRLIHARTVFYEMEGQEIADAAQKTHASLGHRSLDMKQTTVNRDPAGIRVRFNITSNQATGPDRFTTAWQFDYRVAGDELVLDEITPLPTPVIDPETVRQRIVR